ncbi:hypothetical protein GCM10009750_01740 [Agromyces salentinus]|uniref:Uncharacterized protein n=1 Tax=Agromyces salentinus TaxID=269421 RepID=A0ABN2ME98_9MICO
MRLTFRLVVGARRRAVRADPARNWSPDGEPGRMRRPPTKGRTMSIEATIWTVFAVIATVGGVGLLAALWSLVKAPK